MSQVFTENSSEKYRLKKKKKEKNCLNLLGIHLNWRLFMFTFYEKGK